MAQNAFQTFVSAAQSIPGFGNNKPYVQITANEQSTPLCNPPYYGGGPSPSMSPGAYKPSPKQEALASRFRTVRRYTKIASACSNVLSGIFSSLIEGCMIFVTYKFYKTKDLPTPDRPQGPWPKETTVWPTYMFAASAGVTTLLALCVLISLCCRAKRKAAFFSILYSVLHVVFWVAVSATYRIAKKKDDLWGWSCSDKAKEIQKQLGSDALNFERLCAIQGGSWEVSIAEVGFKIITTGVSWYFKRKQTSLESLLDIDGFGFD